MEITHIETKVVHSGEPRPRLGGAVALPIFQTAMYETRGEEGTYHDVRYIRLNNTPNHLVLHDKLAALENAEAALVTSSGMAAISTALLTVLQQGDHLLVQDCLYGGTHTFITHDFARFGIEYDVIDGADPSSWKAKLRSNTRAIYVESIANPMMSVSDLAGVTAFAREHGLVSMIDNTFASPVNFRPAEWGFDLSLHSCTKYLNGHNDIVAGAVIGRSDLVEEVRLKLNHLGGSLDPHACFLLHRGMKTLALRVRHQNVSALALARFLEEHPAVATVNYPGLTANASHERAAEFFDGFGGMLSFELKDGVEAAERLMDRVELPVIAPSLGGVDTLLTRPVTTSHKGLTPAERARLGLSDALVRMSVGIEASEDLIDDLNRALED
ncbi:MAG: PLP-dependent aspartate aminotransferase family protein [Candidatus Krumholzibacteria bacterium]|nr:PLP-dependent aspartate aminotransferase family protein [Candidatus Krumholzibacteria bacterium]MDH4336866.1 PLP-dependent aspartate aminotransferase family protein [Candidatus Krumholzibacteria bacterium]MDH5269197.1 PLP-dependent aspartate aminotransferase family protein [Candidatus Krumholzibacteria bacterium]